MNVAENQDQSPSAGHSRLNAQTGQYKGEKLVMRDLRSAQMITESERIAKNGKH